MRRSQGGAEPEFYLYKKLVGNQQ